MTALHRVIEHDFDGVFRALGLLQSSANSIQTARGTDRIAADHGHLFHYDDVGAEFVSLNGGGQACTTRTDHGNVNGDVFSGAGRAEAGHHSGSNENLLHVGYFLFFVFAGRLLAIPRTPIDSNPGEDTRDSSGDLNPGPII